MVRVLLFEFLCVFEVFVMDAGAGAAEPTISEFGQAPIPSRPGTR